MSGVFKLLSHHHRRVTVTYLATHAGTIPVSDVVDRIALFEGEHTRDRYAHIRTSLVHRHLPALANAGAIEYDHDRGVVEFGEAATAMLPYLESTTD